MARNYSFNGMSRIGNDECYIDQTSIQNTATCNYLLLNYNLADCTMSKTTQLATSQPCVNYHGGFNLGAGGCNVDDSTRLLVGDSKPNPKCKIDLYQRQFLTVPYLGRGSVDPVLETQIQTGQVITNKRSVTKLTEKSYLNYNTTPLIPSVKKRIQDSQTIVEQDAAGGWMRGGLPSRELTRDSQFYQ